MPLLNLVDSMDILQPSAPWSANIWHKLGFLVFTKAVFTFLLCQKIQQRKRMLSCLNVSSLKTNKRTTGHMVGFHLIQTCNNIIMYIEIINVSHCSRPRPQSKHLLIICVKLPGLTKFSNKHCNRDQEKTARLLMWCVELINNAAMVKNFASNVVTGSPNYGWERKSYHDYQQCVQMKRDLHGTVSNSIS